MLDTLLGIHRVRKVYIQLLYACNLRCRHCFHGVLLSSPVRMSADQIEALLTDFRQDYDSREACFLGGEPMLHPDLPASLATARSLGYRTEVCSNGWGWHDRLAACAPNLDLLRVSLDGEQSAHDQMRRDGSFSRAIQTIRAATALGIETGATCTLTAANAAGIPALHRQLADEGVSTLVLHRLRDIGNAATNSLEDLTLEDQKALMSWIRSAPEGPRLSWDGDLEPATCLVGNDTIIDGAIDRVEIAPNGDLYLSCKAVGTAANAFRYDFEERRISRLDRPGDEVNQPVAQVDYRG